MWTCHLKGAGRAGDEFPCLVREVPLYIECDESAGELAGAWLPGWGSVSWLVLSVLGVGDSDGGGNDCKLNDTGVLTPASVSGVFSAPEVLGTGVCFWALAVLGTDGDFLAVATLDNGWESSGNFVGVDLVRDMSVLCALATLIAATDFWGLLAVLAGIVSFFFALTFSLFFFFLTPFSFSDSGTPVTKPVALAMARISFAASFGSSA